VPYIPKGDPTLAANWYPFAVNQLAILKKLGIATRTLTPVSGVTIFLKTNPDKIHIEAGSYGFLFLHRWTAVDEAADPVNIAGELSGKHSLLNAVKKGFAKISPVADKVYAGTKYWANGKDLVSWNVSISPLSYKGIPYERLIGRSRFGGYIFMNGKKVGHEYGTTIYAAKVTDGILAIVANATAFDTLYANTKGDYWVFKQYNNMSIKKVNISQDATKMVVIAMTGFAEKIPADFPANSHVLFDNHWEAVVEYTITKNNDINNPITLTETSRKAQYCMAALGKHIVVSRIIDADITLDEHDAYTPPADIVTTTAGGTMTISQAATSVTYSAMIQYRIVENCTVDIQTYGNSKVMCEDNGNGNVSTILATIYDPDEANAVVAGYDLMLGTGGSQEWFISSLQGWSLTGTKLNLVTTTLTYVRKSSPFRLETIELVNTLVYDTHTVSTTTDMVMDAWYNKDGILKKETVNNARFFKYGHYSYTIKHPYLTDKPCVIDRVFPTDAAISTKTSTASYLFENNYYIEDVITENMSMEVTGGGYIQNTPPLPTTAVLSTVISTDNSGIVFSAIADKNQTTTGFIGVPFYSVFPYPNENFAFNDVGVGVTGFRPVVNRTVIDSIYKDRIILSDRYNNKLYLYTDDSGVKLSAFEVKPSIDNPAIPNPFTPVSTTMLATITAAIKSANDIIGVV